MRGSIHILVYSVASPGFRMIEIRENNFRMTHKNVIKSMQ